mmetsp:Transcript_8199/g.13202  ORF Transcript_8199/g.13202 Transcript_8199/m.13202 type:complete len:258 (-) Transcript_8199:388-1161(-)
MPFGTSSNSSSKWWSGWKTYSTTEFCESWPLFFARLFFRWQCLPSLGVLVLWVRGVRGVRRLAWALPTRPLRSSVTTFDSISSVFSEVSIKLVSAVLSPVTSGKNWSPSASLTTRPVGRGCDRATARMSAALALAWLGSEVTGKGQDLALTLCACLGVGSRQDVWLPVAFFVPKSSTRPHRSQGKGQLHACWRSFTLRGKPGGGPSRGGRSNQSSHPGEAQLRQVWIFWGSMKEDMPFWVSSSLPSGLALGLAGQPR